jgi:trimethylamine--corrinoid protein Co-methyltransferase
VLSADQLESIHEASLRVLAEIGMDFLDADARDVLQAGGARVEPGTQRVRFDPAMVVETIRTAPAQFTLHARNPDHHLVMGGNWMAFGSVASPPNVFDLDRGRLVGNRADNQNLIRLSQMLNVIHFLSGYPVEPIDIHPSIRHLDAIYDVLTLTDKTLHAYSLGRQRNRDALELTRIARGVPEETLDVEPSIFTVINSSSPLRLDAPMCQGILEFSSRNQVIVMTPFTLAGAGTGAARWRPVEQNAEALPGWSHPARQLARRSSTAGSLERRMVPGAPPSGPRGHADGIAGGQRPRRYGMPPLPSISAANSLDAQAAYDPCSRGAR